MLDNIRTFLAVVDAGSLSKVAKNQKIAVSSISRKIDVLEAELSFKVLHRSSRVVILTDAGEQFLPNARNIVFEFDQAKNAVSVLNAEPQGLLTVTAAASFARLHLSPAITSFLKRYPQMEIDLHVSDQIIDLTVQRADVAIRIGKLPDSDLVASLLAPFHRVVCASPEYIAQHGRPKTAEDLLQHNCLTNLFPHNLPGLWTFPNVNKGAPLEVRGNYRSNDTNCLRNAAVDGVGIVHLASWLVSDLIVDGQLELLLPETINMNSKSAPSIQAVRLPARSHAMRAQLFISHLREVFGEPAYWDRALMDKGLNLKNIKSAFN